jgi:hypothetical protein
MVVESATLLFRVVSAVTSEEMSDYYTLTSRLT